MSRQYGVTKTLWHPAVPGVHLDASKTMTCLRRKEMKETWILSWIGVEELERDISEVLQFTDKEVAGV
jgi:hypothetical protein